MRTETGRASRPAAVADLAHRSSGPPHAWDAGIAAELLRLRKAGMGDAAASIPPLPTAPSWASEPATRSASPPREPLAGALARAYAQLVAGDALGAKHTLEYALAASHPTQVPALPRPQSVAKSRARPWPPEVNTDKVEARQPLTRIVVRTLGGFEVLVDGTAPPATKKAARRPLALLKSLIALGGEDVCRTALADALWPELDGDRAQNALTVTLHRLRAYLAVPGAILVRLGRLSLASGLVWVDALAFEVAARAVNPASGYATVERAFELYRGAFLPGDSDTSWSLRARERLRARFVSIVTGCAGALEARGRLSEAAALYERGIAADDLVCAFHDGLVRCLGRLGRAPEAEAARRRMAQLAQAGLR